MMSPLFKRGFATEKAVQLPLRLYSLEGRYASAVYSAAAKSDKLNAVESELGKIKGAIGKSKAMQDFLDDPSQLRDKKRSAVLGMLSGQKYSDIVVNFFTVIAENGRLSHTVKIIDSFEEIMRAHRNEIDIKITSAKELNEATVEKIKSLVSTRFLKKGQIPKVTVVTSPAILGGLILEIGDRTADLSVLSRVDNVRHSLDD